MDKILEKRYAKAKYWLMNLIESSPMDLGYELSGYEWSKILHELADEIED